MPPGIPQKKGLYALLSQYLACFLHGKAIAFKLSAHYFSGPHYFHHKTSMLTGEFITVKCLEWCLVCSKHPINVNYHYNYITNDQELELSESKSQTVINNYTNMPIVKP